MLVALVQIPSERCPDCGDRLELGRFDEPAMFFHGGYGATRSTTVAFCLECGYELVREIAETRVAP